mmetsp:Transcript_9706/g.19669  ORF Transcript_9706/g.19669 Transcript_9706/m.19669 type:complete len:170 (-) Transcript_9706:475-984(-)
MGRAEDDNIVPLILIVNVIVGNHTHIRPLSLSDENESKTNKDEKRIMSVKHLLNQEPQVIMTKSKSTLQNSLIDLHAFLILILILLLTRQQTAHRLLQNTHNLPSIRMTQPLDNIHGTAPLMISRPDALRINPHQHPHDIRIRSGITSAMQGQIRQKVASLGRLGTDAQ